MPLYNFGVSQHFKAFVDLVTTNSRMSAPAELVTAGQPAVLVAVCGGAYGIGMPREGSDHATGWMRRILAEVSRYDLHVVETESTLANVNPVPEQFKPMAAATRAAEQHAAAHGRQLRKGQSA